MNEQRFRILETRALVEIGLPAAFFWATLLFQGLLGAFGADLTIFGINLPVYNTVLALGFTLVWIIAYIWTNTEVIISPKGLRMEAFRAPQWELPWSSLTAWAWDWHWTGVPQGIFFITKGGIAPYRLRLGFIGLGRRLGKVVVPYLPYVPLLKALGYYLPGEQWHEPPPKPLNIKLG